MYFKYLKNQDFNKCVIKINNYVSTFISLYLTDENNIFNGRHYLLCLGRIFVLI